MREDRPQAVEFPPFLLDPRQELLWRGRQRVELRPKTWELLHYLIQHPGQLLTKDELLDAVWKDTEVSPASLNQAILELRHALGDDAREPRFIRTVHRRGFRFIAEVRPLEAGQTPEPRPSHLPALGRHAHGARSALHGRGAELEELGERFQAARAGRLQIVFLTGEPGIGKTHLLRAFLEHLAEDEATGPVWITGGHCVELHGEKESYLPILEAIERLAQEGGTRLVSPILRRFAPCWLAQLPHLWDPGDSRRSRTTPTRMLHEFTGVMEAFSSKRPLVLWLEDLQWSDLATLDVLAALAARANRARLLILVTYRPVDAAMGGHAIAPLKRKLVQQDHCRELALELLDETAVRAYLRERFATELHPKLAALIHEQSDGNPLFMVALLGYLVANGAIAHAGEDQGFKLTRSIESLGTSGMSSLREIVDAQLDGMADDELQVLAAASVVGETFPGQLVAAALGDEVLTIEKVCTRLAGWGRFLDPAGPGHWPDGSVGERYRFQHAVFRDILYRRLTAAQRQQFHRRIATRLAEGHAGQPGGVAAELAWHFERGGDPGRAIPHLVQAAAGVRQRCGDREAVAYFDRALALLATLPDSDARARRELELRMHRWREVNASTIISATEQDTSLEHALELCDRVGDLRSRAYVSSYRTRSLIIECELDAAASVNEQRVESASSVGDPILQSVAHGELGDIAFYRGELGRAQREHALCVSALEDVDPHEPHRQLGHDPAVLASGYLGWTRWLQGHPDQARRQAAACVARAGAGDYPLDQAFALILALTAEQLRRDADAAGRLARSFDELVDEYGFHLPYPGVRTAMGWARGQEGGSDAALASLREGISLSGRTRARQGKSQLLATLAEAELERGGAREGLAALEEALAFVEETGERFWEAEIHRLKGELLRLDGGDEAAEASFQSALEVARRQGARSLELRAATSMAQLWKTGGRKDAARALLVPVYDAFTEGFDTLDLRDAKILLDSL